MLFKALNEIGTGALFLHSFFLPGSYFFITKYLVSFSLLTLHLTPFLSFSPKFCTDFFLSLNLFTFFPFSLLSATTFSIFLDRRWFSTNYFNAVLFFFLLLCSHTRVLIFSPHLLHPKVRRDSSSSSSTDLQAFPVWPPPRLRSLRVCS